MYQRFATRTYGTLTSGCASSASASCSWRDFRHLLTIHPIEVTKKAAQFCKSITDALLKRPLHGELVD